MTAVYPGSFDPVTLGHLDIIKRASRLYERLIVAVLNNSSKDQVFTAEERTGMITELCVGLSNVEVASFSGLLADFVRANKASVVIRGLRAVTDFEYEFQMALTNRSLHDEIETVFLPASLQYLYLSSSVAKEVFMLGGNVDSMLPPEVEKRMRLKTKQNQYNIKR